MNRPRVVAIGIEGQHHAFQVTTRRWLAGVSMRDRHRRCLTNNEEMAGLCVNEVQDTEVSQVTESRVQMDRSKPTKKSIIL